MTTINIGQRIRDLREGEGLSLRALAERCGLSFNAISRIERGENSPTVATLHRLAQALEVPIADFFRPQSPAQLVLFTKANDGFRTETEEVAIESLGSGLPNQQLEAFRMEIKPGLETLDSPVAHPGEEFVLCLQGELEYCISEKTYQLSPGDSLLFKATQPHCWRNRGEETAVILIVFQSVSDHPLLWRQHLTT